MDRILEALKQIQATSAGLRRDVLPDPSAEADSGAQQVPEPAVQVASLEHPAAREIAPVSAPDRAADSPPRLSREKPIEQYRELVDNILAQLSPGRPAALMFTSVHDGEGKTATLASLAPVLAERTAHDVVAVDANFRSPQLASHFEIATDRGLTDVLAGRAHWAHVIQKTAIQRLHVLPGGRPPAKDGSLPKPADLDSLLDDLRKHYRIVLLDTASLSYPEVAPISESCDGTYLVIRAGRTARRAARQAARLIQRWGGRLLGCVLTGVPAEG